MPRGFFEQVEIVKLFFAWYTVKSVVSLLTVMRYVQPNLDKARAKRTSAITEFGLPLRGKAHKKQESDWLGHNEMIETR